MEINKDMTVSQWLEDNFRHFDDFTVLFDDDKVYVGKSILKDKIKRLENELRKLRDEGPNCQLEVKEGFGYASDIYYEQLRELSNGLSSAIRSRESLRQKLYGIKGGRRALAIMGRYIGPRSAQDRVVGYEIFLEGYEEGKLTPRHQGFAEAVIRRLNWERRKADGEKLERFEKINPRLRGVAA
ncbi:MAG: hypothetical protein KJ858_01885 [Nanoarchaeota archaeon]|nr:hypothetical protein [Nanoarchaeota archaeon]